jgi:ArsR family transcriptional regulator
MANEAGAVQVPALLAAAPRAEVLQAEVPQVEVLRALAHSVRWGILRRLAAEPGICACDFTEFFDVSQPTISAHLKVLREAGLVTAQRNGTTICYSIAPSRLESLSRALADMTATAVVPLSEASSAPDGYLGPAIPRTATAPTA